MSSIDYKARFIRRSLNSQ